MLQSLLRKNFRAQLIVPVAIALLIIFIGAITFTVFKQKSSSDALNKQVASSFNEIEASIDKDLGELSKELDSNLLRMQEEASSQLAKKSSSALQARASGVRANMQAIRQQTGHNMAQLMAISAINSVITKDFAALNGYVRSAHQNKDIVFLFYRDKDLHPLTRFLNRNNEKLKSFQFFS